MSEERPAYDAGGTVEVEIPVLIDLLKLAHRNHNLLRDADVYRADDLRRRIMEGQVYVGVCDWPVEEVSGG